MTSKRSKSCPTCKAVKPIGEFYMSNGEPSSQCKACHRKTVARRYYETRGKVAPPAYDADPLDLDYRAATTARRSNDQLRAEIAELLGRKGLRAPQYVARHLGISVELAAQLMAEV